MLKDIIVAIIGPIGGAIILLFIQMLVSKIKKPKQFQISKGTKINMIDDFSGELNAFIRRAEKEVFIICGSMRQFSATEDIINKLIKDKNIKFYILALNIEKKEILDGFKKILGDMAVADNLNHFRVFNNNKNVEMRIYETLPTSYFYAVDLHHGLKGTIQVLPILFDKPELDCPQIEINRGNEKLYEFYSNYIEDFWKRGSPFE